MIDKQYNLWNVFLGTKLSTLFIYLILFLGSITASFGHSFEASNNISETKFQKAKETPTNNFAHEFLLFEIEEPEENQNDKKSSFLIASLIYNLDHSAIFYLSPTRFAKGKSVFFIRETPFYLLFHSIKIPNINL